MVFFAASSRSWSSRARFSSLDVCGGGGAGSGSASGSDSGVVFVASGSVASFARFAVVASSSAVVVPASRATTASRVVSSRSSRGAFGISVISVVSSKDMLGSGVRRRGRARGEVRGRRASRPEFRRSGLVTQTRLFQGNTAPWLLTPRTRPRSSPAPRTRAASLPSPSRPRGGCRARGRGSPSSSSSLRRTSPFRSR